MIEPRYLSVRTKRARYTKEVEREDGNMSITRSISVAQTNNSSNSKLLSRLIFLLRPCETVQGKATMIMSSFLSAIRSERDIRKKYGRRERGTRIEEDNMSISRSISIA